MVDEEFQYLKYNKFLPTLPSLLDEPCVPFIHRDLSWMQFNERVLEQARPSSNNLVMERVKFAAISANNLDEFFMVRIASLLKSISTERSQARKDSQIRIRDLLLEKIQLFESRQSELVDLLTDELSDVGVHLIADLKKNSVVEAYARKVFETHVRPYLHMIEEFDVRKVKSLSNLQMAAIFKGGLWMKIPISLPSLFSYEDTKTNQTYYFPLDRLIQAFLGPVFNQIKPPVVVRLTRDADISDDLMSGEVSPTPEVISERLKGFDKGKPVRLQYLGTLGPKLMEAVNDQLKLSPRQIFLGTNTLNLSSLWRVVNGSVRSRDSTKLLYPDIYSHLPNLFKNPKKIFSEIKAKDCLMHHPYDSFDAFVTWIETACKDRQVKEIQLTIYRMGTLSRILMALKKAARKKRVRIMIELRARFDEQNNLNLADTLAKAGAEVSFGFGKLKLHAKMATVTRIEAGKEVVYTHLSTGNYNEKTASIYTDLAIFTANQAVGEDARKFFEAASQGRVPSGFKHLLIAPTKLHRRLLSLIKTEIESHKAGKKSRIVIKANSLVDKKTTEYLYRASQAGVKVDLIIRGACSLIPRVANLSENIRVISVIDRFLEHSRIYYFQSSEQMYLSSADCMPRNFFKRLEIAFPVLDKNIYDFIVDELFTAYLSDTVKARELSSKGSWRKRRAGKNPVRAQFYFSELAAQGYKGTHLNPHF